ncbi:preprotein translocase subunit SecE [Desulfobacterales bacterium HSG16]|nr:preprotein translocase subunit SecE [Desulfobacterales bacterium HSG16]
MARLQKKKSPAKKKEQKKDIDVLTSDSLSKKKVETSGEAHKKSGVTKSSSGPRKKNWITDTFQFLREVKAELKKVTWPSRKQTMGSTIVVIVVVMIISSFLALIDAGLSSLIQSIL